MRDAQSNGFLGALKKARCKSIGLCSIIVVEIIIVESVEIVSKISVEIIMKGAI